MLNLGPRPKMRVEEKWKLKIRRKHTRFLQKARKMTSSHKQKIKLTTRGSWTNY